jgi:hypothetical protein
MHSTFVRSKRYESDMKFFYIPPQTLSKPMSVLIENRMIVDRGIRHSRILLKYHERIVD